VSERDELVSSQPRTRGALQIRRREYRGATFADIRAWYFDETTGELKPGKGATIRPAELRETIAALTKIAEAFEREDA
jgi:hypothetical protein